MTDTQLTIGAQARAARTVVDSLDPLRSRLEDLGTEIESSMAGFRGGAAAGLGEALQAWFDAAADLLPTLQGYAQRLVAVDVAEARTELQSQEHFARLAARLGGQ